MPHAVWDFPPSNSTPEVKPTIEYRVNVPKLTQLVTGKNFHYFKLYLVDIHRFFTTKKSWNHDYAAAQAIYSDSPTSVALRAAIAAEHSLLYSSRPWRYGNVEGAIPRTPTAFVDFLEEYSDTKSIFSTIHSSMKSGLEAVNLIAKKAKEPLEIYTYTLMEDSLRFSRSGAGTSVDMSSKHALHAGAAAEVCYAGEFWIQYNLDGTRTLYMDNNSGTFAPPKADLFRMKFLMEANFPGIPLVMLDYKDEEWIAKRKGEEKLK